MADDIVTRLRAAARTGDLPLGVSFDCDAVADEIERLWAAGDALADALRCILDGVGEAVEEDDLLATWKEARRG